MNNLIVFDFDGTLFKCDSTKFAYKCLYNKKLFFFFSYYLLNTHWYIFYLLFNDFSPLAKSRCVYLRKKFNILKLSDSFKFKSSLYHIRILNELEKASLSNYKIIVVSAGIKEIIYSLLPKHIDTILIANSFNDLCLPFINYEQKVVSLNLFFKDNFSIHAAYGNTRGDIPLLKLSKKAYWVNADGSFNEINF